MTVSPACHLSFTQPIATACACLLLSLGAVTLSGCLPDMSGVLAPEEETGIHRTVDGNKLYPKAPSAETVVGVWVVDPDSRQSSSVLKDVLILDETGEVFYYTGSSGYVGTGSWTLGEDAADVAIDLRGKGEIESYAVYVYEDGGIDMVGGKYDSRTPFVKADDSEAEPTRSFVMGIVDDQNAAAIEAAWVEKNLPDIGYATIRRNKETMRERTDVSEVPDTFPITTSAPDYWYYSQLSADEQAVYDACMELYRRPDSQDIVAYATLSPDCKAVVSDDLGLIGLMSKAREFLKRDHPEYALFEPTISIQLVGANDEGFTVALFTRRSAGEYFDIASVQPYLEELATAAQALLAGIDLSQPQAKVELDIHDALIALVSYDHAQGDIGNQERLEAFESGESGDTDSRFAQFAAHSAYGALVRAHGGVPNLAVCEGYAQAFQLLLQMAGIEAASVEGIAGLPGSEEAHEWVLVRLDGEWYAVDPTWDDKDAEWERHRYFNLTSEQMGNDAETGEVHVQGGREQYDDYVIIDPAQDAADAMAPVAYGTTYTYDAILGM